MHRETLLAYMSDMIYVTTTPSEKPLVWHHGEVETSPFSRAARLEAGKLLRRLEQGEILVLPQSRPVSSVGPRCHELRTQDENQSWRIIYRIDRDAIVIIDGFAKTTMATPKRVIENCKRRLRAYDAATEER
jgi:phage-related protein